MSDLIILSVSGSAWLTPKIFLGNNDEEVDRTIAQMTDQAKALTEATGCEIEFKHTKEQPQLFGVFGRFVVKRLTHC